MKALIPHAKPRLRRPDLRQASGGAFCSRIFLKLQRAHCCNRLKAMIETRSHRSLVTHLNARAEARSPIAPIVEFAYYPRRLLLFTIYYLRFTLTSQ